MSEQFEPKMRIGPWAIGKVGPAEKQSEAPISPIIGNVSPDPVVKPFTDITIILDKSGSMESLRTTAVEEINKYMRTVDEVPGDGCWTLVTFDDHNSAVGAGEAFPLIVFDRVDSKRRPMLELQSYVPRGGTALIDAIYSTVSAARFRKEHSPDRKMLVVIMTDGMENASREHTSAQLRELIGKCAKDGWEFLYLGANQDAFAVADGIGTRQVHSPYFGGVHATYQASPAGMAAVLNCPTGSASSGTRSWKCDGNDTAAALQGDGQPDMVAKKSADMLKAGVKSS